LFGIWARPTDQLRLNLDLELFSADHAPTRISPRNLQHYKVRVNYKPKGWMNVSGTTNILESRDNVTDILHREHNRNYGFTMMLHPSTAAATPTCSAECWAGRRAAGFPSSSRT